MCLHPALSVAQALSALLALAHLQVRDLVCHVVVPRVPFVALPVEPWTQAIAAATGMSGI